MPSLYYPELNDAYRRSEGKLQIIAEEYHHLVRVRHARVGEVVKLNSGAGVMAQARITEIKKQHAILEVLDYQEQPPFIAPYAIAFALLKNRHDELLVEKCTELGVGEFFPFSTEFSVRKAGSGTMDRFRKIALAAIKQCDNPYLPKVHEPLNLESAIEEMSQLGYHPVLCSERRPDAWLASLRMASDAKPCFIIGPEGGFSASEFALLEGMGVAEISLGTLVTRAETAGIVAAAQWLAYANQAITTGTT